MNALSERRAAFLLLAALIASPSLFAGDVLLRTCTMRRDVSSITPSDPIAEVAVRALFDDATSGTEYMITGPHSLTQREQVLTIGDVIGRTLRFEEMTSDEARRDLGFPRAAIDMLLDAWSAAVGLPDYVTTTVAEVTGTPARTFAEWVRSNQQAFVRPDGRLPR